MNAATPCARCGTPTPAHELSMSLEGDGFVCQPCTLTARSAQQKAGMRKAYLLGAILVGIPAIIVILRIVLRVYLANR